MSSDNIGHQHHPLDGVSRTRLRCDECDHEVSVYATDDTPAALCECGRPMHEVVRE